MPERYYTSLNYNKYMGNLITDPITKFVVTGEYLFDPSENVQLLISFVENPYDWQTVVNTSLGIDLLDQEVLVSGVAIGTDVSFRIIFVAPDANAQDYVRTEIVTGKQPAGTRVEAIDSDTHEMIGHAVAAYSGHWKMELPPGSYDFRFMKYATHKNIVYRKKVGVGNSVGPASMSLENYTKQLAVTRAVQHIAHADDYDFVIYSLFKDNSLRNMSVDQSLDMAYSRYGRLYFGLSFFEYLVIGLSSE